MDATLLLFTLLVLIVLLSLWLSLPRRPKRTLLSLPNEILHEIAENLPLESVMALSLASKEFRVILTQQASKLSHDPIATFMFLQLLVHDMRPRFLCDRYKKEGDLEIANCPHARVALGHKDPLWSQRWYVVHLMLSKRRCRIPSTCRRCLERVCARVSCRCLKMLVIHTSNSLVRGWMQEARVTDGR